jgi:hypothetical protein
MHVVDRITGRHNALEIVLVDGRLVARRYLVFGRLEDSRDVVSSELSEGPVEELELPLSARDAAAWLYQHFQDLTPVQFRAAVARLSRRADEGGELA